MAFTDFTSLNKVKESYSELIIGKSDFIPEKLSNIEIAPMFEKDIKFALQTYKPNESFADKFFIVPIINRIWQNHEMLNVWTETYIKADEKLQGRPDYLVSILDNKQYEILSLPIVAIVEAKHENFTLGWGQCLAEMLACQKLNNTKDVSIYGIVATGLQWEFAKLDGNNFIKNAIPFSITNLQQTINVVNFIFDQAEKEIPKLDKSVVLPDNELNDEKKVHNRVGRE